MDKQYKFLLFGLIGGLVITFIAAILFSDKFDAVTDILEKSPKVTISGKVDLNGSVESGATIAVAQRISGQEEFSIIAKNLSAQDGVNWSWDGAEENKNYDLQAYLQKDGANVAVSPIVTATAPAVHEELVINTAHKPDAKNNASISGNFDINGHIPVGSLVSVKELSPQENTVAANLEAVDRGVWGWGGAKENTTYQLQAYLTNTSGSIIGKSAILSITAPATNETFTINSTDQPPKPQTGTISGHIDLNGSVPDNSRIVVFQKEVGSNDAKVAADNIAPKDGAQWKWNQAVTGKQYDLFAVLKVKRSDGTDKDIANSGNLRVHAPAGNEVLTINTNYSIPKPSQPRVDCNSDAGNNQYNITVNMDKMTDAATYWLEIGTQNGGNDKVNTKFGQTQNAPQYKTTINNNTTYYTRYSYAYCSNCADRNFSEFSDTLSFSCPGGASPSPKPAYTGYVCKMGTGCQLTTDPNAPYSFNNEGLNKCQAACVQPSPSPSPNPSPSPSPSPEPSPSGKYSSCNQSCGGDGYECVTGLQCVSGALIGSSVCRNPNCTEETDCKCN